MTVGDIDRHRVTVGWCCEKFRHAGRTGTAGNVDNRYALPEHWLHKLTDETRELIGAATRSPRDDQFDRSLGISGRNGLATEQRGTDNQRHKHREASPDRTHGLPPCQPAACLLPARGRARQDAGPAYVCRLIAEVRIRPRGEVSFYETTVLNTLTEGLGPARVNSRRCVSLYENSVSNAVVPGGFLTDSWQDAAARR